MRGNRGPIRFGHFTLDRAQRLLTRHGTAVHLTPKAFELLSVLVAAAPRVVTKAELHAELWPESFVSDATLTGLIKELRRSLEDNDPAWPVIRTVHGVGYACTGREDEHGKQPGPTSCWLLVRGRPMVLHEGENVIGRDPAADIWLDAPSVSRHHARITVTAERVTLEDLGSKNGTTLGGAPATGAAALSDRDAITFGSVACVYRSSSAGVTTETASRTSVAKASGGSGSRRRDP
jgi:DNA-binding winged helix-turn-helix (wHTH) protein